MIKKFWLPPMAAVLCGLAGAVIRGLELKLAFETGSWFAIPRHPASVTLVIFTALFALCAAVYSARAKFTRLSGVSALCEGGAGKTFMPLSALAVLCVGAGAARDFYLFMTAREVLWHRMIFAILAVVVGLCALSLCSGIFRGKAIPSAGVCALAPIFWGALWLLYTYWARSADPVLLDYIYELLAVMFAVISFYFIGGFMFGAPPPGKTTFCMLMAVFLATLNSGGIVFSMFLGRTMTELEVQNLPYFGFALFYCAAFLLAALRKSARE